MLQGVEWGTRGTFALGTGQACTGGMDLNPLGIYTDSAVIKSRGDRMPDSQNAHVETLIS